ncbi:hypothetical protein [Nannocystis pusilla]|uniref:DUF1554 domain-containing protein n=1 Tax=Nannocystis pusilla TaxID=889268 RepID=A0ABS7TUQ8_9BACT|nr:hypothetical protein [Nannocystis pusilla]MBZ5711997.1 hypothetical protein [Nannocystis pusilla]
MRSVARVLASLLLSACTAPGLKSIDWDGGSTTSSSSSSSSGGSSSGVMSTTGDVDAGSGSGSGEASSTGEGTSSESTSSAASSTDTTGSSSDGEGFCGDGKFDKGEECDDGNADDHDACNSSCKRERMVFVTGEKFQPDNIGGLMHADGICRQLAEKGGLVGFATYKAWLSDTKEAARDRVWNGEGRYVRPDGVEVAESFAALLAGPLLAPINIAEDKTMVSGSGAWTGTMPDGSAAPGSTHCEDWTSSTVADMSGYYGDPSLTSSRWTFNTIGNPTSCVAAFHLYCFEGK